ncbi:MAG: T9SS type A sorting domain-containing protein [Bacteroidetes bacterium]|nr:T9SS type A sorting domain-containing protein [Bacteroidota bacterium]
MSQYWHASHSIYYYRQFHLFYIQQSGITGASENINPKEITIFPNPAQINSDISCIIYGDKEQDITLKIITLEGKLVSQNNEKLVLGENNKTIKKINQTGAYFWK